MRPFFTREIALLGPIHPDTGLATSCIPLEIVPGRSMRVPGTFRSQEAAGRVSLGFLRLALTPKGNCDMMEFPFGIFQHHRVVPAYDNESWYRIAVYVGELPMGSSEVLVPSRTQ